MGPTCPKHEKEMECFHKIPIIMLSTRKNDRKVPCSSLVADVYGRKGKAPNSINSQISGKKRNKSFPPPINVSGVLFGNSSENFSSKLFEVPAALQVQEAVTFQAIPAYDSYRRCCSRKDKALHFHHAARAAHATHTMVRIPVHCLAL